MKSILSLALFCSISSAFAILPAKVHFIKPHNNEVVTATFPVEFSVDGLVATKAGEVKAGTGHHHIIIDGSSIPTGTVIPKDDNHKHFGDGSSKTTLSLKPGKHTLTLQFADGIHKSLGEEFSETISVEVK